MNEPRRKSIRLEGFNYASNGFYYVTICCAERKHVFGGVVNNPGNSLNALTPMTSIMENEYHVELTPEGQLCQQLLENLRSNEGQFHVAEFIVMPDHVHLIVVSEKCNTESKHLGDFVHFIKASISRAIRKDKPSLALWQKGYFEHVIRDLNDYERIVEYIASNPTRWAIKKRETMKHADASENGDARFAG